MLNKIKTILLSILMLISFGALAQSYHIDGYVLIEEKLLPVENQAVEIMDEQGNLLSWFFTNDRGLYSGDFEVLPGSASFIVAELWKICDGIPVSYSSQIALDKLYLTASFFVCEDQECRAKFNVVQTNLDQLQFEFTDISHGDINEWHWDFGDGSFSDEQNPVHEYLQEDHYQVKLTISGNNCSDEKHMGMFAFYRDCLAKFSWEQSNQGDDLMVHFADESQGDVIFWFWDFGDGFLSEEQSPTHQYGAAGEYEVVQSVHKPACWHTITQTIHIAAIPDCFAHFGSEQLISENLEVVFTDLSIADSILNWAWQFGDGAMSSNKNPTHIFESAGTYEVSLTISSLNCADTFIRNMTIVGSDSCVADFDFQQPDPDAPEVFFQNLAQADSLQYFWDFGDGNVSNVHSPSHLYTDFGSYDVGLKILGYGCADSVMQTIVLVEPVYCGADFIFDQDFPQSRMITFTNQSFGNGISSVWDFGDGTVSSEPDPVHEFTSAGLYEVWLFITTTGNCSDSLQKLVEILPPFEIKGKVWAGDNLLVLGNVNLYKEVGSQEIEWYGQQMLSDGSFSFIELTPGSYFLQAIPVFDFPFPMIPNYFPTYSGQEMKWQDALVIDTDNLPDEVQLQLLHYNDFFDGKASLMGSVNVQPKSSNSPLIIYLTDDYDQIMGFRLIDEEMKFEFINIPFGYYKVYPEKAGKSGQAFSVELNESLPEMNNLVFIESADLIYPDLTAIDELLESAVTISPNPANDQLHISFSEQFDLNGLNLWIYSANGLSLPLSVNDTRNIFINVSEFPQGLYLLELTTMKTKIHQKFLIQH